ncbi:MAG TPA: EAL domain-containing protein [Acidimicrobiia bacterium]|nr:EAL domain-containing protein [Acidimicrobiia bacterium]
MRKLARRKDAHAAKNAGPRPNDRPTAVIADCFVPIVATDLDGNVTEWNSAAERLFGWSADEVLGRPVDVIVPEERREELGELLAGVRRGDEIDPIDTVRRARDGATVNVRIQVSPITAPPGVAVGASMVMFENAAQVRTRASLAASMERYRTLVDALTEFVVTTDPDGVVHTPQRSWTEYTGQSMDACVGTGWRDALHSTDRERLDRVWEDCATFDPFTLRGRVFHAATGDYRRCEFRFAPVRDDLGDVAEWIGAITDVDDRYRSEHRERSVADRFRRIFDANVFGICYGDSARLIDANDAMLAMFGADRSQLNAGIPMRELVVAPMGQFSRTPFGDGEAREFEINRLDDTTGYVLAMGIALEAEGTWVAVAADLTQRKLFEREIEYRSLHDALTGLPNRRLLVDRLQHALNRSSRAENLVAVLFCDLDHFKEINDAHGHAAGDRVLAVVADRLQELVRDADTVARVGGDEFVVVLEDLVEPDDALQIAERIRNALSEDVQFDGHFLRGSASIGVTLSTGSNDRVETLLSHADEAMYRAKERGRNRVAIGTGGKQAQSHRRMLERELDRALERGDLGLAFQPVVDLRDGRPIAAEALLRWELNGDRLPAASVISIAEDSGMIMRLSDWVMRTACREFAAWRRAHDGAAAWRLHVNVSACDLADARFEERMLTAIAEGGLAPTDVCLELTETAMVSHPADANARLASLREAGVSIAIDDFGMGYASLGVLRDVPADIVKIDRSFIDGLQSSARDRAIVEHAIELAHQFGLKVVGEGVETLAQMAILDEIGCDQAQGYAFAFPTPVEDLPLTL